MKFSRSKFFSKGPSWSALALAIVAAIAMWWGVSKRDMVEAEIEVSVSYRDIPSNLVVTSGLVNKLLVRIRAPQTLLHSLPQERLTDVISLNSIKQGKNIIPIPTKDFIPRAGSFEIIDIQPTRLDIVAEPLSERRVPVEVIFVAPHDEPDLTATAYSADPAYVTLRGPEKTLAAQKNVSVTVELDPKKIGQATTTSRLFFDTPSFVTADPNSVEVHYTLTAPHVTLTRKCKVAFTEGGEADCIIQPQFIDVTIEVLERKSRSPAYLKEIEVSVDAPALQPGESKKMKLHTHLPEGMRLIGLSQDEVTISRRD